MKKMGLFFIIMLTIGLLGACSNDENENEENEEMVSAVETVQAELGDLGIEKSVYGRTGPSEITPVLVSVAGEVDELKVENGDKVEEDDIIAKLKTQMGVQDLKAPKDGEVIQLEAKEGDLVTEENPFAMIANLEKMEISFSVTDKVRELFKTEDKLKTIISDKEFEAEVTSVGKMPDDTGLYPITAKVENEDDDILSGMTVLIKVTEERIKESIILPTEAIVEEAEGSFVYLLEEDHVVKEEIDVKATQSDRTAIEGEVEEGDQVVINGQMTLSDGSKVNVVKEGN